MWTPSYLQRNRYGIFYFRRAIPMSLRSIIGKAEFICSLRTRDPREAVQLARFNTIIVDRYFAEAFMAKKRKSSSTMDFTTKITFLDGTKIEHETTPSDIAAMKEAGLSPDQIADVLKSSPIPTLNPQTKPTDTSASGSNQLNVITLKELISQFVAHWQDEHGGRKMADVQLTKLRRLEEILGSGTPIETINIESAEMVRQTLARLPANSRPYRGLSAMQIVNATSGENIDRLGNKTRNDHLEAYTALFNYAKKRYRMQHANPFSGVRVIVSAKEKTIKARRAFTRSHLQTIFSTPIHTTPDLSMPYRYWVPLIGLFTGARRGSISSLYLHDIKEVNGVWVLDFNENEGDKREKTANGFRLTPIHPFLIDLGLLDYVKDLSDRGERRLLPDLSNWTEKELYGRAIGEWFNGSDRRRPGFLEKLGIRGNKGEYVFHSFRHTLTTELRRAGADVLIVEQICGRSDGLKSVGQQEYTEADFLPTLFAVLSKVNFNDELKLVRPYMQGSLPKSPTGRSSP